MSGSSDSGCGCVLSFMGGIVLLAGFVFLNAYTNGWLVVGIIVLVVLGLAAKAID